MGIQGLLPQLKSIMVPIHIQDLKGQTVAVDTYSWLHKGALSCSTNLCKGIPTSKHIGYCMHRVNLLRHHGVKPVLVFDGGFLPMKTDQETKRSRSRRENLERAMEHEAAGNSTAAFECYQKAVDISPLVALGLIKVLKQERVDYIVAPYEADAQMTFLCMNRHVDAVITEDSDLIPFGCSRGVQFLSSMLGQNKELDLSGFTKEMLLEMCIFSGCDYLQSLPGMGLKRAHALVQKFKSYEKVIKHLRYSSISLPPLYEENFRKAMWAFQLQRVYDPTQKEIVHLSELPPDIGEELDFLGPWLPPNIVKGIAEGDLDPFTKLPFQVEATATDLMLNKPYSVKESTFASGKKKLDLPVQKNILTNYFCLASLEAKRKFRAPKIKPKCMMTMESSPLSSENVESDSPEEASPIIENQQVSLPSKVWDNDISPNVSLSFHQKQFRAPTIMPKCLVATDQSSASSNSQESSSPASATATSPTLDHQQSSLSSRDSVFDLQSNDSIESTPGNEKSNPVEPPLQGNTVSYSCSPLESQNESLRPFSMSYKKQGFALDANGRGSVLDGNNSNMKSSVRKVIKRSSYFLHKTFDKNDIDDENEEPLENKERNCPTSDYPVATASLITNGYPKSAMKKRKLLHPYDTQSESQLARNRQITSVKEDTPTLVNKAEGNFGCDVSHLRKYSGIAEESMERFVSIINSFRYTPPNSGSGSRASGLRRPLKDVRNTCPVRPNARPVDISEFAYKPKNKTV